MLPGERFKNWVDGLAMDWKDRLGGWMGSWAAAGLTKSMEDLEPGVIDQVQETIRKIIDNPATPPETKRMLEMAVEEGNILQVVMGWVFTVIGLIPALFGLGGPLGNTFNHAQELVMRSQILDLEKIIEIWRRDKPQNERWFEDLKFFGYDDERIAVIKELAKIIPPLADMVRFADFSAFDPDVIAKWKQFYDAPGWISDPMELIGITNETPRDWANKYWFSHWRQPGRYELGDMYRRGLLGKPLIGQDEIGGGSTEGEAEATIKLAYKTMGYSSFWQDALLDLVREIPTRVDVRRWWDMRTIDETELRSIYQRQGYFGKDLENYVIWTKVYVAFPDLMARWKNGWITMDDVKRELTGLGMPAARVEEMIETKIKAAQPERTANERDLTKSEIVKGVKKEVISDREGIELLMDMGYDEDEADYILAINIAAAAGSPETFAEFKDLTQKYRLASGKEAKPMPEELKQAAQQLIQLRKEVDSLKAAVAAEEATLVDEEVLPRGATAKRDELRVALHRAEAELDRVQGEYDGLLAEWRHKEA